MSRFRLLALLGVLPAAGCLHVKMDVYAKVDVNVRLEQAVADVLADIYGDSTTVNPSALPANADGGARP